ncbi:MAG: hypothetical protein FWH07_08375 [Oscillospiraceae bacterium]|nr:hypothetical protein [Oscillospiraceae bacterium]
MKKRISSFVLALVMLVCLLPPSAADDGGAVTVRSANFSFSENVFTVSLNLETARALSTLDVDCILVPAGTSSGALGTFQKYPMELGLDQTYRFEIEGKARPNVTNEMGSRFVFMDYELPDGKLLEFGDYNLWFFVDDLPAMTVERFWRVIINIDGLDWYQNGDRNNIISAGSRRPDSVIEFDGRESSNNVEYVMRTQRFCFYVYNVSPGPARVEYFKIDENPRTSSPAASVDIPKTGTNTITHPTNLTGMFALYYTKDGGANRELFAYTSVFKGVAVFSEYGRERPGKTFLDPSSAVGTWTSEDEDALLVDVRVAFEDFELPTNLVLFNIVDNTIAHSYPAFDNDAILSEIYNRRSYRFRITLPTLADGVYGVRAERAQEKTIEALRFEVWRGRVYRLRPGEIPVSPLSVDDDELKNAYLRLFLGSEQLSFATTGFNAFSTDGGVKWQAMNKFQSVAAKWFDRGFEVWFSDKPAATTGTKKPPDDSKLLKFPKVGGRAPAPRLEVNYALAHMENGVMNFEVHDENLWVAVERGTTTPIGEGYVYRIEATRENNRGYDVPTGRPDMNAGVFTMLSTGLPIPDSDLIENERTEVSRFKQVTEGYFVSTAAYIKDGVYYPSSKAARLRVRSYGRPPAIRADYKKETLRLAPGIVVENDDIFVGIVSRDDAKVPIDISSMLGSSSGLGACYQLAPTAKRPASEYVDWQAATRHTGRSLTPIPKTDGKRYALENGKFRASKDVEFRFTHIPNAKWGAFKALKTGEERYEYRFKSTARNSKLIFEDGEWYIDDSIVLLRDDERDVYAAGTPHEFIYTWGTFTDSKGKERTGITSTNLTDS